MSTKHYQRWKRCWMGVVLMLMAVVALAGQNKKLMLVINSYDEAEPWANDMVIPITKFLANIDSVGCEIVNLDNALISDSTMYNNMVDNVFSGYEDTPPAYIAMVGNFAFSLRDRIKEEWGDIPMLLISRINTFSSVEANYCAHTEMVTEDRGTPLQNVRGDYNFTAIIVPDCYRENVDLMVKLNPKMKELVYLSTNIYVSRYEAGNISLYLAETYPDIKFTWLQASPDNSATFQDYMLNRTVDKGFLMASWVYEKQGARGFNVLTSNDLRLMPSSKNPVFALRESYVTMGCIGGVYVDGEDVKEKIVETVRKMISGTSMRSVPFYSPDHIVTKLNYRLLREYGLSEYNSPKDTSFFYKPAGYWEKYMWQTVVVLLVGLLFFGLMWWKMAEQKSNLARAKYNDFFMNNMPVPFAKAEVRYKSGHVQNIVYKSENEAFANLISENAIPDNPFLLFPAEFISQKTEDLLRTGQNVVFNYHFEKTDTMYNFIICSVTSNKSDRGGVLSVVDIFASDITSRMKLERRLHSVVRKLNLALTVSHTVPWQWNLKTGIVTFDDLGQLGRTFSQKVKYADGYEEWHIAYDDFIKRVHPDDSDLLAKQREDFVAGTIRDNNIQVRMYKELHSEETDWIQLYSAVTESDEDGDSLIVTGTLRIITTEKQQEEDMAKAKERAEESDRMKSAFLANMSHEIRTPLNAIVGFSNLIADAESEEERAEFKEIINTNNELLLTLVNDVLDLAKIESNTIDINYTVADINAVLQSAEQSTKLRLNPGVRLNIVLGQDRCVAETDPVRLSQVLINLLTNACKFTTEGSITLGYKMQGHDTLYFYVSDTGIGISKEGQKKVFERFVKLNNFAQGTGLGLSICKRLVEMLGGEMGVRSEGEGCGSTFWFTIPFVPVAEESAEEETDQPQETPDEAGGEAKPAAKEDNKPTVLVAEDYESNYKLIVHLMKERFRLVRAMTGKEAVELFREIHPDIILMDINMPVMNGYQAVEAIRQEDDKVPIIAVTAYAYASDRIRIMNSGFNGYVSKPVNQKALAEVLRSIEKGGG